MNGTAVRPAITSVARRPKRPLRPCQVYAGGCRRRRAGSMLRPRRRLMALSLTSPSFQDHGEIPIEYTHDGKCR